MRPILIALVVLLAFHVASAATADVWVYPGEPFSFQGTTYYAFLDNSMTSAVIQSNDTRVILDLETCDRENFVRYCFDEVANMTNLDRIKYDVNNNILYSMRLSLQTLGPQVKATQTYSTTKPDINGRIDGEITISNSGNEDAEYIVLTYEISGNAYLHACSDCETSRRSFTKRYRRIEAGESRTTTFALTVEEATDFTSEANVSFSFEGEQGSAGPLTQSFGIKKPYSTKLSESGSAAVGEWIDLTFEVSNTGDNPISVEATPIENASLRYENAAYHDARELEDLTLDPGEKHTYRYRARSTKAGTYGTGFDVRVERGGEVFEETLTASPSWSLQDVTLIAQLSKLSPASGDTNTLFVTIENTGTLSFRDLDVSVDGEVELDTRIDALGSGKLVTVFEEHLRHPKTNTTLERELNVTLRYDTRYGEEQTTTKRITYTIFPVNESYRIKRSVSPREPEVGERFTVTVHGTKTVDSAVQYTPVTDRLVGGRILHGNNKLTPIASRSEELLYQYEAVREDERFAIITSLSASYQGEERTISEIYATFNLSDEDVQRAVDSPENVLQLTDEDEERNDTAAPDEGNTTDPADEPAATSEDEQSEPAFFTRIVDWLVGLFS